MPLTSNLFVVDPCLPLNKVSKVVSLALENLQLIQRRFLSLSFSVGGPMSGGFGKCDRRSVMVCSASFRNLPNLKAV